MAVNCWFHFYFNSRKAILDFSQATEVVVMGFESDSCFERGQQRTSSVWKAVEYAVTFNQLFDYRLTFSVCGEANTIPLTLLHITHHFSLHCLRELCYSLFFFFFSWEGQSNRGQLQSWILWKVCWETTLNGNIGPYISSAALLFWDSAAEWFAVYSHFMAIIFKQRHLPWYQTFQLHQSPPGCLW